METTTSVREGNMGQTLTAEGFMFEGLDDVQSEIENWYTNYSRPFIRKHREIVFQAAYAEA
jgi:hypothetical protein